MLVKSIAPVSPEKRPGALHDEPSPSRARAVKPKSVSSPVASSAAAAPSPPRPASVARTGTFLEEDLVDPRLIPKVELAEIRETAMQGHAAFAIGSNKHHRATYRGWPNEDKVLLKHTTWHEDGQVVVRALFAAVFDGHGGEGLASEYVANHLHANFIALLETQDVALPRTERVTRALELAFVKTDVDLYARVKSEAAKAKTASKSRCKCKFFLEDPCACVGPPIPANEGSTGTVLVITATDVFCANIGDSDAILFSRRSRAPPTDEASPPALSAASSSLSPPSLSRKRARVQTALEHSGITVTDTPMVDEASEDFQRIHKIARARKSHAKTYDAPANGILVNGQASRFNYVAVPGARSLNMTRAFGNLGHKVVRDGRIIEEESPIISRPHVSHTPRVPSMHSIVVGSDGLWDNVSIDKIVDVIGELEDDDDDDDDDDAATEGSQRAAKQLLKMAVASKRKPDDISVIVIPLLRHGAVP